MFGTSFIAFTTEVAPGAGTKVAAEALENGLFLQKVKMAFGAPGDAQEVSYDNPLPVTMLGGGTPFYADTPASGVVTEPGQDQELIKFTVPANTVRAISNVIVACRAEGKFTVMAGSAIIGSGRTGPASPNPKFPWTPSRPIQPGTEVKVLFHAAQGTYPRPIEAYLQASDRQA